MRHRCKIRRIDRAAIESITDYPVAEIPTRDELVVEVQRDGRTAAVATFSVENTLVDVRRGIAEAEERAKVAA